MNRWRALLWLALAPACAFAGATVTPVVTYTDVESNTQTITGNASTCTAVSSSNAQTGHPFMPKVGTSIQYYVTTASAPTGYIVRVEVHPITAF
jgi:hypothetical protein